jgi:hypothetical protein
MEKLNGRNFLVYILSLAVLMAGIGVLKGALYVDQHEGDMLHLIDIVLRMAEGQTPHLDFMTPLGILAFLPFSTLVSKGMGIGSALIWGQIAFASLVLPMIWWVCHSRLNAVQSYVLATAAIVTSLAFIYGSTDPYVSLSMHYNRWAWALAFVAVPTAVFSPRSSGPAFDGLILGLAMSFFIFGKVTYAVALAPGLVIALMMTRQWWALAIGVAVVGIVAGILTVHSGVGVWQAYFADLKLVSGTDIRPRAGESWMSLLFSPKFIMAHAVLVASIIWLRKGVDANLGAMLALLAPGFAFIAYQNYGNDPKWLILVAVILLGALQDPKRLALAGAALIVIAPSYVNMGFSPFRHALSNEAGYIAAFEASQHTDFLTIKTRDQRIQVGQPLVFEDATFRPLNDLAAHSEFPRIGDTEFPPCLLQLGLLTSMRSIAEDLKEQGIAANKIFTADTFGSFWMFGEDGPTRHAAPWYYGGLSGFDEATHVLIPICAITPRAVKSAINDIAARGVELREVRKTELYVIYEKIS